jgi:hypothetical protein
MQHDTYSIIFVFLLLLVIIYFLIRFAIKIRKHGGSPTTLMYGATDEFYNKDKKKAIEYVVELKANKKMEEQTTGQKSGNSNETVK